MIMFSTWNPFRTITKQNKPLSSIKPQISSFSHLQENSCSDKVAVAKRGCSLGSDTMRVSCRCFPCPPSCVWGESERDRALSYMMKRLLRVGVGSPDRKIACASKYRPMRLCSDCVQASLEIVTPWNHSGSQVFQLMFCDFFFFVLK